MSEDIESILNDAGFETVRLDKPSLIEGPVWECKIGLTKEKMAKLPRGSDSPMREAVEQMFRNITGQDADFCFSGWGAELDDAQQWVINLEGLKYDAD